MTNPFAQQTAKHFHDIHFGGNWTVSNVKGQLEKISMEEALIQVEDFNTIATLTFHMSYFVDVALNFFKNGKVVGEDKLSFNHPPIHSEEDWRMMISHYLIQAEELTEIIKSLPDEKLLADFGESKYGNHFRNLHGIVEHTHYHLGQISLIKKMIASKA